MFNAKHKNIIFCRKKNLLSFHFFLSLKFLVSNYFLYIDELDNIIEITVYLPNNKVTSTRVKK